MKIILFLLFILTFPTAVSAIDREAVEKQLGVELKEINKSPFTGIHELVTVENQVIYISDSGKYLIYGNIIDLEKHRNLTQETIDRVSKVEFSSLPFQNAIKVSSGKKKLAVFHDLDCPYCRKLHKELKKMKDVEIHYFLFNLSNHPKAYGKAKKIYCAKNPIQALDKAMDGDPLTHLEDCATNTVDENKALSEKVGVRGTPHMIMENGLALRGYRTAEVIRRELDKIKQ